MTDDLLAACERADRLATPGPWIDTSTPTEVGPIKGGDWQDICQDPNHDDRENDRAFICLARTALPTLVARVRELEAWMNNFIDSGTAPLPIRIKMWLESNCEERIASAECYKLEGALTARFIDGERTESLLGEMQALTKEMSK